MATPGGLWAVLDAVAASAAGATQLDALARLGARLHPVVVHFPIALLIVGAVIETTRAVRGRAFGPSPAGLLCWGFGTAGAMAASGTGWLNGAIEQGAGSDTMEVHRWIGVGVAAASVLVLLLGVAAARRERERDEARGGLVAMYRLGTVVTAAAVGVGAHFGGMMTYGETYLSDAIRAVVSPSSAGGAARSGAAGAAPPAPANAPPVGNAEGKIDFASQVKPILAAACFDCHGAGKHKGRLALDNRTGAMQGGKNGPSIVPGDPEGSLLIERILGEGDGDRMPLEREPLTDEQTRILTEWIRQGATWPDEHAGTRAEEQQHWAYIGPVRPKEPPARKKNWVRNPIDSFVLSRLELEGLSPSPEADRATLIRRVSLDLTGLPPTVEEVDAFEADRSDGAYERVVDRLLASPAYGERMAGAAGGWLDAARYADSQGYEKDGPRTIWLYRDWVIDALNRDMPFDRFTIEQIAGDLLPDATEATRIATGFHRNSMINEEGGTDPEESRVNAVIDRVSTTATVWLGATLACAQCHDHKFDPFSQEEFYRFFAFFNTAAEESTQQKGGEYFVEISPKLRVPDPRDAGLRRDLAALEEAIGLMLGRDEARAAASREEADLLRSVARPRVETLVMQEQAGGRATYVHRKGDFRNRAGEVRAGVPAVLPAMRGAEQADRLALARWLVSAENPLTARVTVNRMWAHHFGRGIVETTEDFGTRGSPPSHPELLDWLATEFVRVGWSQKAMHRLMVTSAVYRQASGLPAAMLERDPANVLLARGPRGRLEGEVIRDQAMAVSGLLCRDMGGPSVFPVQPEGVWSNPYSDNRYPSSGWRDRHRRAVYTFWKRSSPYPSFATFDAPSRQVACTRRNRSNTPLQSLVTLNDPVFVEAAGGLAARMLRGAGPGAAERAAVGFRMCLARKPSADEVARLVRLYEQQVANYRADPAAAKELLAGCGLRGGEWGDAELAAWTVVANVILNLDETLTTG